MATTCSMSASPVAPSRPRFGRVGRVVPIPRRASRAASLDDDRNAPPFLVPSDCFTDGTFPPEKKAATSMRLLFTMVALRVVLAQEEGFGNECHDDPSYTELYDDLTSFLQKEPLRDSGDAWLEKLIRHPKVHCRLAAVRIIEVRDVYASEEFDWEETKAVVLREMEQCRRTVLSWTFAEK